MRFSKNFVAGNQLEALHLPPVRGVAQHVDEEQLGHVAMAQLVTLFLESRANRSAFLVDASALVRLRFARTHIANQLAQPNGHVPSVF